MLSLSLCCADAAVPNPPIKINVTSFSPKNVTVALTWGQEDDTVYIVRFVTAPDVPIVYMGNSAAELVVSYSTVYNVSVVTHCGQDSTNFFVEKLNYGELMMQLDLLCFRMHLIFNRKVQLSTGSTILYDCIRLYGSSLSWNSCYYRLYLSRYNWNKQNSLSDLYG